MAITHFHDGRIFIVTIAGTPGSADVTTACAAVRANAKAAPSPVLVDARECGAPELADWVGQMLDAGTGTSRFAILLNNDRQLTDGATFRLIAAEHGADARVFDTVGPALRWLWGLEDSAAAAAIPEIQIKSARRSRARRAQAQDARTR